MSDRTDGFGGLPVFPTSWDPSGLEFPPDSDFETGIEELVLQGEMEDSLDDAMTGKSSPRIWLLLHEQGQGPLSAVSALYFARELASRDQGVLVLDCDEEDPTLARWAGRLGSEGWADLARYGASVLTCGIQLPFPGRHGYLLGPGSYSPVDIQPNEIDQILSRLRRQADDIILVCPLGEAGRWWAPAAEIRIFCWNTGATSGERVAAVVEGLERSGTPLTGLVRFGAEPEAKPVVDGVGVPEPKTETAGPVDEPGRGAPAAGKAVPPVADYARKRGTSRVFWWMALAAVALIAMAGWYYVEYVREPGLDSPVGTGSPVAAGGGNSSETEGLAAEPGSRTTALDVPAAAMDSVTVAGQPATGDSLMTGSGLANRDVATDAAADAAAERPDEVVTAAPTAAASGETGGSADAQGEAGAGFFMDPYLIPVGEDGWALHVYSFPDEEGTAEQVEILHRKGFMTETRAVQIKDKGRWHRIYLGSFPTRAAAQEALEPLLKELGQDWGRPTEF